MDETLTVSSAGPLQTPSFIRARIGVTRIHVPARPTVGSSTHSPTCRAKAALQAEWLCWGLLLGRQGNLTSWWGESLIAGRASATPALLVPQSFLSFFPCLSDFLHSVLLILPAQSSLPSYVPALLLKNPILSLRNKDKKQSIPQKRVWALGHSPWVQIPVPLLMSCVVTGKTLTSLCLLCKMGVILVRSHLQRMTGRLK